MPVLLAIDTTWWVFLHLVGVFGFLIAHGGSMAAAVKLRKERDRTHIRQLLRLSGETLIAMYLSLVLLLAGGILAAVQRGYWSAAAWPKISLGVTIAMILLMGALARPYYKKINDACEMRPSGVPRVSDEDLAARLRGWQPFAIIGVGYAALLALLYMMVFKRPV